MKGKKKFKFGDKVAFTLFSTRDCPSKPDKAIFIANTKLKRSGSNCIVLFERAWNKYFPYSIRRVNTKNLRRGWKK